MQLHIFEPFRLKTLTELYWPSFKKEVNLKINFNKTAAPIHFIHKIILLQ